jgi:hypothetical protein
MNETIKKTNGDFEILDKCIICSKDTQYTRSTHIDNRIGYIEGCGQTCTDCYKTEIL